MAVGIQAEGHPGGARRDGFHSDCPGRVLFRHVANRWGVLILTALRHGPLRFAALRDGVDGISEKMLSRNLRDLVRDGLVHREVEPTTPPGVTYSLTPLGEQLAARVHGLLTWVGDHTPDVLAARRRHDEARP
ncbi:winged helix-turn-helix transcriptional regulator [Saccharothrix australiensis]|uniref:HxlR family transcriptional regulator n=1 Tax=Saccharothrix australiensis TaxID=2072 RepID=A0A495W0E1_9PSEU|nr:helix-turn-helix domain-containing protein [Saccharothrix australiensis]RKT54919.1 HxlR family transcriptional regulator [Saccharothrix australiensis]